MQKGCLDAYLTSRCDVYNSVSAPFRWGGSSIGRARGANPLRHQPWQSEGSLRLRPDRAIVAECEAADTLLQISCSPCRSRSTELFNHHGLGRHSLMTDHRLMSRSAPGALHCLLQTQPNTFRWGRLALVGCGSKTKEGIAKLTVRKEFSVLACWVVLELAKEWIQSNVKWRRGQTDGMIQGASCDRTEYGQRYMKFPLAASSVWNAEF